MNSWFKPTDWEGSVKALPKLDDKTGRRARVLKAEKDWQASAPVTLDCPPAGDESGEAPEWEVTARQAALDILAGAREDALREIKAAREEAEQIRREAEAAGREQGLAEGRREAGVLLQNLAARQGEALAMLDRIVEHLGQDADAMVTARAKAVAECFLGSVFEEHGELFEAYLRHAVQAVGEDHVAVYLPPRWLPRVKAWQATMASAGKTLNLVASDSEGLQTLVIRYDGGGIDAGIRAVLEQMGDALP